MESESKPNGSNGPNGRPVWSWVKINKGRTCKPMKYRSKGCERCGVLITFKKDNKKYCKKCKDWLTHKKYWEESKVGEYQDKRPPIDRGFPRLLARYKARRTPAEWKEMLRIARSKR